MGRELQKRKRRSSRPAIRQPQRSKKPLNPLGNSTVAKNWNKKETLSQNYRRLGLVARLKAPSGGAERIPHQKQGPRAAADSDPFAIRPATQAVVAEARVERDADGRIVRILGRGDNPLRDLLNDLDSDEDDGEGDLGGGSRAGPEQDDEWDGIDEADGDSSERPRVVRELEREAAQPVEKRIRHQSAREVEWLQRLVDRHGDDTAAMARDSKLNPMQQTAADIARRISRWKRRIGEM